MKDVKSRRSIVTGMGIAAAGLAAAASPAKAQDNRSGFRPERHALDAWLDQVEGGHRIFVDSATGDGAGNALLYANNLFQAHTSAYDGDVSDLDIVVCFRHFSTPYGYSDAVWEKYGEAIHGVTPVPGLAANAVPETNPFNSPDPAYGGVTIGSVAGRGARFAICENATRFFAAQLAAATDSSANEVFDELVAGAIDDSRFVSAGVIALTRAQEYGYSLLYAG
jgi:hypothetical protein